MQDVAKLEPVDTETTPPELVDLEGAAPKRPPAELLEVGPAELGPVEPKRPPPELLEVKAKPDEPKRPPPELLEVGGGTDEPKRPPPELLELEPTGAGLGLAGLGVAEPKRPKEVWVGTRGCQSLLGDFISRTSRIVASMLRVWGAASSVPYPETS